MLGWLNVMNRPAGAIHHFRERELVLGTDELNRTITQIGGFRATPADQPQSLSVIGTLGSPNLPPNRHGLTPTHRHMVLDTDHPVLRLLGLSFVISL
jgi:hypothetical protein